MGLLVELFQLHVLVKIARCAHLLDIKLSKGLDYFLRFRGVYNHGELARNGLLFFYLHSSRTAGASCLPLVRRSIRHDRHALEWTMTEVVRVEEITVFDVWLLTVYGDQQLISLLGC